MYYHFKIHKEQNEYWAECIELEGCVTQGINKKELDDNMREALNLYLDEPDSSKTIFKLPKNIVKKNNIIKAKVSPNIAFAFLLRRERLRAERTQADVAKELGLKNLWSYQKLERGKSANPALKTLFAIKQVFPGLAIEKIF